MGTYGQKILWKIFLSEIQFPSTGNLEALKELSNMVFKSAPAQARKGITH